MQVASQQIYRRAAAPLNVASGIECLSSGSPRTQVYDTDADNVYQPDRTVTATVLVPRISVKRDDAAGQTRSYGNADLADMHWYVNGEDITTLTDWTDLYSITADGDDKGAISIWRNVEPSEQFSLHFEAKIYDNLLGKNVDVITDPVLLSTVVKAESAHSMRFESADSGLYNPIKDNLLMYQYKVSRGELAYSSTQETALAAEAGSYLHTVKILLWKGGVEKALTAEAGYSARLFRVNGTLADSKELDLTEINISTDAAEEATDGDELAAINLPELTFDMRMIDTKTTYLVRIYNAAGAMVTQRQFTLGRVRSNYKAKIINDGNLIAGQLKNINKARIHNLGAVQEHPELLYKMAWSSLNDDGTVARQLNEGEKVEVDLTAAGVAASGGMTLTLETDHKGGYAYAADSSGNIYTDSDGTPWIFNS